jgi:hypothetical protein
MNEVTLSGQIKNLTERGAGAYKVITGNITLRGSDGRCIVTMPVVISDPKVKESLRSVSFDEQGVSEYVNVFGRLSTRFDTRPNVPNEQRRAPMTRIEIHSVAGI